MLTLFAVSALLSMQEPPSPPAPPAPPEGARRVFVLGGDGHGALDKDGDGQVSREEFAAPMNDHFARIDKDGDGRLSTEELSAGHDGPDGVRRFELRRPHDGDREEHAMVFLGRDGPGSGGGREVVIRSIGEDGPRILHLPSGEGGHGETRVEVRRPGGEGGAHDLDKDGDGKVSEAEFTAPLRDAFARMDADRSGYVEADERGGDGDVRVFTHRIETRRESGN